MNKRGFTPIVGLLLLGILLAGCGSGSAPEATPAPTAAPTSAPGQTAPVSAEGWTLNQVPKDRFAIALPPDWEQVDMDPSKFLASMQALSERNADAAAQIEGQARALASAGVAFFGFDPEAEALAAGVPTDANVQRQPLGGPMTLDEITSLALQNLENSEAVEKPVSNRTVTLEAGEAAEFRFRANVTDQNGNPLALAITQYLIIRRQDLYVVTLTTTADKADAYAATFEAIGKSLRFIPPARADVEIEGHPTIGSPDAPVTIVEFSEFECPYCARYVQETFPQIDEVYIQTGKVKYVFRHFPLSFHEHAQKAAEASACAEEQGMFWEYHDVLFAHQNALDVASLKQHAEDLGLDVAKFNACLDSGAMAERVQKDASDGASLGVSGTPSFFINGIALSGARPFSSFQDIIEEELGN